MQDRPEPQATLVEERAELECVDFDFGLLQLRSIQADPSEIARLLEEVAALEIRIAALRRRLTAGL